MNKVTIILLIALIPLALFLVWVSQGSSFFQFSSEGVGKQTVRIGNVSVLSSIADTMEGRQRGLSGMDRLPENEGMFFIFDEIGAHGIWMKEMKFSIDIIWIAPNSDGGYEVIDIKKEARPDTFPEIFYPNRSASHVLEVNSGFVDVRSISIGDKVSIPN